MRIAVEYTKQPILYLMSMSTAGIRYHFNFIQAFPGEPSLLEHVRKNTTKAWMTQFGAPILA